jgi:hypothetical protein
MCPSVNVETLRAAPTAELRSRLLATSPRNVSNDACDRHTHTSACQLTQAVHNSVLYSIQAPKPTLAALTADHWYWTNYVPLKTCIWYTECYRHSLYAYIYVTGCHNINTIGNVCVQGVYFMRQLSFVNPDATWARVWAVDGVSYVNTTKEPRRSGNR